MVEISRGTGERDRLKNVKLSTREERMFNHAERAAGGDASSSTRHHLRAFRADAAYTREHRHPANTRSHASPK